MFEDYLRDTCDIYHLEETDVSAGYGIEATPVMDWQNEPHSTDVACHFHVKSEALVVAQHEPQSNIDGNVKLTLPIGIDIRKNDIVVSRTSESIEPGLKFRADAPRTIHGGHHMTVMLRREEGQKGAI